MSSGNNINERIKIHGSETFEISIGYLWDEDKKKHISYGVDCYYLIPQSLNINKRTFYKEEFYKDIKTNIRLVTPIYSLNKICKKTDSPYKDLTDCLDLFLKKNIDKKKITYQFKIFCNIYRSSLNMECNKIKKKMNTHNIDKDLSTLHDNVSYILAKYQELKEKINGNTKGEEIFETFNYGDNYLGMLTCEYLSKLLKSLENLPNIKDNKNYKLIIDLIQNEWNYQDSIGNRLASHKSENNNGIFLNKRALLKKYIESVLFLETVQKKDARMLKELLYGIAAGIAMIFATGIAFFFQKRYGNLTYPFFIALVLSYMAKDRIKELFRHYFSKLVKGHSYDFKTSIFSSEGEIIGSYEEGVDYINPKNIPKELNVLHRETLINEIARLHLKEEILLHKKRIKINKSKVKNLLNNYKVNGIKDIMRFNINRLTHKSDLFKIPLYTVEEGELKHTHGVRLYNINILLAFTLDENKIYKKYRVIFNRKGIKKIESTT